MVDLLGGTKGFQIRNAQSDAYNELVCKCRKL